MTNVVLAKTHAIDPKTSEHHLQLRPIVQTVSMKTATAMPTVMIRQEIVTAILNAIVCQRVLHVLRTVGVVETNAAAGNVDSSGV